MQLLKLAIPLLTAAREEAIVVKCRGIVSMSARVAATKGEVFRAEESEAFSVISSGRVIPSLPDRAA